nr:50S ribosomal protein L4P [uncultured archaeon]
MEQGQEENKMKTKLLDISGKEKSSIELPKEFSAVIREDIVAKVLEAKKTQQPYAPSLVAGKQHSAKGRVVHRRHVWRSGYGRGASRVPRKIFSRKGSQFNWQAAEVPQARGGMRAHPPKIAGFLNKLKINKKEIKIAFESALSATANEKYVSKKYSRLEDKKIKAPFVVEGKITELKIKEILKSLKEILGNELYGIAIRKKSVRAGKGKLRGRKYKSNAGMLMVTGNNEKLKTNAFETKKAKEVNTTDLANGGLGRLTVYTEKAIKDLGDKFKENKK